MTSTTRAMGITWMAVRGEDPLKIKQRAGHSSLETSEGYVREAGQVRAALPAAILSAA
jgi:hypothetical protein